MGKPVANVWSVLSGHPLAMHLLEKTGAVLEGHFELSQGLRSDIRIEMDLLLDPSEYREQIAMLLAWEIARDHSPLSVDGIVGPTSWGDVEAELTAHHLGYIWGKKLIVGKASKCFNGFKVEFDRVIDPVKNMFVELDDVYTTGWTTDETAKAVEKEGCVVVDRYVIASRRGNAIKSLVSGILNHWDADSCPLTEPLERRHPCQAFDTGAGP